MSVTTRTNLATNPRATSTTGYAAVAGTGGTAALSNQTTGGPTSPSVPTFNRVTWSVATTAVSGGASYTCTGLAASTAYAFQVWVRSSKAQTVQLSVAFQTSVPATVNTVTSVNVALTANTWTQVTVTGTSGASVTQAVLTAQAVTGGSNWANGDTFDITAVFPETGSVAGSYFDGSFVNAAGVVYAWTGTANASTSTATTYAPYITLVQGSTPSPNVQVTWQDFDSQAGGDTINVWRTVDGIRRPVRGCRRINVVGSGFTVDYEPALGRQVSYDIEILSGVCAGVVVTTATTTLTGSASGWLSDPLAPATAIPVYADVGPNGEPGLDFDALATWDYKATVSKLDVMGTSEPVALVGQRQTAAGIDVKVTTLATAQSNALRVLLKQAAVLLFRPLATWASGLPGLAYVVAPDIVESPINEKMGGQMVGWSIKSDTVAPPAAQVVVPTVTYGTVSGNYTTYASFAAAHTGQSYLQVEQSP